MTTHLYLDQFLDNLENLSPELTRNFNAIRELDIRVQDLLIEIDKLKAEYLEKIKLMDNETRVTKLNEINEKYRLLKNFGDEKVQLANQTYEMVDKHIRRLDGDLARFEAEIKERNLRPVTETDAHLPNESNLAISNANASNVTQPTTSESTSKRKKRKTEHASANVEDTSHAAPVNSFTLMGLAQPADVLDMPVDPNEPTYCLCHQVSYGEMIGCDNLECPIEWFHFGCVGLTNKPKGKWYCPPCAEKRKKN